MYLLFLFSNKYILNACVPHLYMFLYKSKKKLYDLALQYLATYPIIYNFPKLLVRFSRSLDYTS